MNFLQRVKIIGGIQVGIFLMGAVGLAAPGYQVSVLGMWNGVPVFNENDKAILDQSKATRKILLELGDGRSGNCTATFVSQTTAVTAAHCVDKHIILGFTGIPKDSDNYKKLADSAKIVVENGSEKIEAVNWFYLEMEKEGRPVSQNDHGVVVFPANTADKLGIKSFPKIKTDSNVAAGDVVTLVGYGNAGKIQEHYIAPYYERLKKINAEAVHNKDIALLDQTYEMRDLLTVYAEVTQVLDGMNKQGVAFYSVDQNQIYVMSLLQKLANVNKKDIEVKSSVDLRLVLNQFIEKFKAHPLYWDGKKVGYTSVYQITDSILVTEGGLYRNQENDGKDVVAVRGDSGGTVLNAQGELIGVISLLSENPQYKDISGELAVFDATNVLARTSSVQAAYLYNKAQDCQKISDGPCADLGVDLKALNERVASADQDLVKDLEPVFHVQVGKATEAPANEAKKASAPLVANN